MKFSTAIFKTFFLSLAMVAQVNFCYAQTASILPNAKTTFVDQNGKPLTSGTVDFYSPGTSTRKTTWQDGSKVTANTNPVVLDAAGRALIWGDGSYRQVVKDRNGNLIWDQVTSSASSGSGGGSTVGDGLSVGSILPWSGLIPPPQYLLAYGQAISRTTYSSLLNAITINTSITCTGGSPALTNISDTSQISVGAKIEASCLLAAGTVISKTASSVTLGSNANVSIVTTGVFFPYGNGDSLTTFNLPDLRGYVLAGRTNMGGVTASNLTTTYFSSNSNNTPAGVYAIGGAQSSTLLTANLPPYTPAGTITNGAITITHNANANVVSNAPGGGSGSVSQQNATITASQAASTFAGTAQGGTSTAFSQVQPTVTVNYIIKVLPDSSAASVNSVTSIGGMFGIITCGTGIICSGNSISTNLTARGTAGYALIGNGAGLDATYQGYLGYNASTQRTWQTKAQDVFSVMDYAADNGCIPNGTTDCTAAFNAAITAAAAYAASNPYTGTGSTVYIPAQPNCYRITSTLNLAIRVSLVGAGMGTCIYADNTDAITMNYNVGNGQQKISNLTIYGANATAARIAINRPGTTNDAFSAYGLVISNVQTYNFDTALYLKTQLNVWLTDSWFQNVNQCVNLTGFSAVIKIHGLQCVKGTGAVGSSTDGIGLYQFNYTTGSGLVSPEGVEIQQTQINGFNTAINADSAVFVTISNNDLSATVTDIRFNDARGGLYINNNYLALVGAAGNWGIHGLGTLTDADTQINIYSNTLISSTSVISLGIQINELATANQNHVNIVRNLFDGFAIADVQVYAPKQVNIDNNRMRSAIANSITLAAASGGINSITNNETVGTIVANATDITNGVVRKSDNIVGGVREASTWNVTTNSLTSGQLVIGGGAGVQPTASAVGTGVLTALSTNVGSAGAFTVYGGTGNFTAFSAGADGTTANIGPNGTGSVNATLALLGSSAAGFGARMAFVKNGTTNWYIGHQSSVEGSGSSSNLEFLNVLTNQHTIALTTDDSVTFAGNIGTPSPTTKTTNYTLTSLDSSLIFNGAGSITLTLQSAASYPGRFLWVKTIAAQTVVSASSNVVPLIGGSAGTAILAATAGKWAMLQSDGTNWIIMAGN